MTTYKRIFHVGFDWIGLIALTSLANQLKAAGNPDFLVTAFVFVLGLPIVVHASIVIVNIYSDHIKTQNEATREAAHRNDLPEDRHGETLGERD